MVTDTAPVTLREITRDNFDAIIALQVTDDQRSFVPPIVESIAWAHVASECHPLTIYASDTPVGFVMYGYIPDDRLCWIIGFIVAARFQRHGIGRAALEQLLARMMAESDDARIILTVHPDNIAAIRLYEGFGFQDTGRRQNDEMVMRLSQ